MHYNIGRRLVVMGWILLCLACPTLAEEDDSFFEAIGETPPPAAQAETPVPSQETPVPQPDPIEPTAQPAVEVWGADTGTIDTATEPENTQQSWIYPVPIALLTAGDDYIRLVNVDNLLDNRYKPDDLEDVKVRKSKNVEIKLRKAANDALAQMYEDAANQGITLYTLSGFRSYQTQATMYENRLEANGGKDDKAVQYPGASDHQTGLGVDVISKSVIGKSLTRSFEGEPEAQWMAEHCWEYGFIIRYPKDKEDITGIIFEPWHLRYVGSVEVAAHIMLNGLTLEEFTEEWQTELAKYDGTLLTPLYMGG